jgi:hypothetical protein
MQRTAYGFQPETAMYRVVPPFGWMTKMGARHVAGRLSVASMRASPACESGKVPVVAVGPALASAPQSREADTVVAGPAVPSEGRIRPSMLISSSPLALSRTLESLSTQGRRLRRCRGTAGRWGRSAQGPSGRALHRFRCRVSFREDSVWATRPRPSADCAGVPPRGSRAQQGAPGARARPPRAEHRTRRRSHRR